MPTLLIDEGGGRVTPVTLPNDFTITGVYFPSDNTVVISRQQTPGVNLLLHCQTATTSLTAGYTQTANWTTMPLFMTTGPGIIQYNNISSATSSVFTRYDAMAMPLRRPPLARPTILRGRRALRRSIELFCMLRPEEEIRTFLSGRPLLVHGHRYDYRMEKRGDVLMQTIHPPSGHIPYDLQVLDKASGRSLAHGCVFIKNTPVIDQLLAVILHAEDPKAEAKLLANTNWSPPLRLAA